MPPTFTVIIPTYNRSAFLTEALGSVLAQTHQDFECIVVDDASPSAPDVVADPRVRLVRRASNGGPAASRNTGIEHASGEYITFLDDDDLFSPDRLARALEALDQAPVALCWSRFLDGSVRRTLDYQGNVHDIIVDQGVPSLGATTVRAASVLKFDERFEALQDTDWWLRMSRENPVCTVQHFGYLVRKHPGVRNRNDSAAKVRCGVLLLEKHADYFSRHPRAAAIRWRRVGRMARRLGDRALARKALGTSFAIRPSPRTLLYLARSLGPSTVQLLPS